MHDFKNKVDMGRFVTSLSKNVHLLYIGRGELLAMRETLTFFLAVPRNMRDFSSRTRD